MALSTYVPPWYETHADSHIWYARRECQKFQTHHTDGNNVDLVVVFLCALIYVVVLFQLPLGRILLTVDRFWSHPCLQRHKKLSTAVVLSRLEDEWSSRLQCTCEPIRRRERGIGRT